MSGLGEYLLDVLPSVDCADGGKINMATYGDSIFRPSYSILRKIANRKNDGEKILNQRMNRCRTSVGILFLATRAREVGSPLEIAETQESHNSQVK